MLNVEKFEKFDADTRPVSLSSDHLRRNKSVIKFIYVINCFNV